MPVNPKFVILKPTTAGYAFRQLLLVFIIMILAVQPTAPVSAQTILQQPASGGQVALFGPQNVTSSTSILPVDLLSRYRRQTSISAASL